MLFREIITVCSQIHAKLINTLCGQKVELLNVKAGGAYSNHWTLEGYYGRWGGAETLGFIARGQI